MTLEAWVNPTTVTTAWRDVIYKGNDNYYLMATSTTRLQTRRWRRPSGAHQGGVRSLRDSNEHLDPPRHDLRRLEPCACIVNGTQVGTKAVTGTIATSTNPLQIGGDSIYGQFFAGPHRRRPGVLHRPHRDADHART